MKQKYLLFKIMGIVGLILGVLAYFLFYFFPSLEQINRSKRNIKDLNQKIAAYFLEENQFVFPNEKERGVFQAMDDELRARLAPVKTKEDFIVLFTRVFDYIKTQARRDNITELMITSDSNELELNATTISSDKKRFQKLLNFANLRRKELERDNRYAKKNTINPGDTTEPPAPAGPPPLLPGMTSHTIYLSFTGELRNGLNFINHLPWGSHYLKVDNILISSGDMEPYFIVDVMIYYINERPQNESE